MLKISENGRNLLTALHCLL